MPTAPAKTKPLPKTPSEVTANEVKALIRARNPIIWIQTREEPRVERFLMEAIAKAGYIPYTWDVGEGLTVDPTRPPLPTLAALEATLEKIKEASMVLAPLPGAPPESDLRKRIVWIMRDMPAWITGNAQARALRKLRNLARRLPGTPRETAQVIIVLSPQADIPPELNDHVAVVKWPLPDRVEIARSFDACVANQPTLTVTRAVREAAIDAAVGLSDEQAMSCFARTMSNRRIDPKVIANEKKRIVARDGLIEWHDPIPEGLSAVGGLNELKGWLIEREDAFGEEARKYGLPMPKGAMLVGISGCGKSLTSKTIATAWSRPLLRIDLGALKGGVVGKSEGNLRNAFETIGAIGRCVVWFDEIEKALQGAMGGSRDGGVSADQLGYVLKWMDDNKGEAFVIATANDIRAILDNCPELLRKGRFDEIFFVDLPNLSERVEILKITLRHFKRDNLKLDLNKIASNADKFTGSEVASLVSSAMYAAFADGKREITTNDLLKVAKKVVPLSKTAGDKIDELRRWVNAGNARRATSLEEKPATVARIQREIREVDFTEDEDETEDAE